MNGLYNAYLLPITISTTKSLSFSTSYLYTQTSIESSVVVSKLKSSGTSEVYLISPVTLLESIQSKPQESGSDVEYENISTYTAKETPTTSSIDTSGQGTEQDNADPFLVYGILGALAGLCILVVIGSFIFKHPKMHSKYGRKNSFGTLNTVATGKTNKSV